MKLNLFFLFILFSVSVYGQIVTKEAYQICTTEKNSKTIIFHKKSINLNESVLVTALNHSSSDFTSCSWEVDLSIDAINQLHQVLAKINFNSNSQITYKKFSVKVKRGKVRVVFFNSSCLNEHSTSYFQKACNRKLSFFISRDQIKSFVQVFDDKFFNVTAIK